MGMFMLSLGLKWQNQPMNTMQQKEGLKNFWKKYTMILTLVMICQGYRKFRSPIGIGTLVLAHAVGTWVHSGKINALDTNVFGWQCGLLQITMVNGQMLTAQEKGILFVSKR